MNSVSMSDIDDIEKEILNCHVFVRLCNSDDLVSSQAPYRVGKISHRRTTPRFPPISLPVRILNSFSYHMIFCE